MSRPYILISNDDGVQARGINFLIETLRPIADLLVVAPDSPRSGFGCSITSAAPIHYKKLHEEPGLTVCSCTGTPVDCVKLALNLLIDRRPDLIIGGINHGDNSSVNTHYSGTMGVATEGALQGYPSVAFSLCDHREDADFTPLASYIVDLVFKSIALGMPPFTCLNVNFPKANKFKGVRICRMAHSRWQHELARRKHPYGATISGWWATARNWSRKPPTPTAGPWHTDMWPSRRPTST